ncbi:peptidase inhibitor family I36 protein [Streptomyces sp. NPDC057555]|uniref:peptidase inhibitor family I36 protein n=1 Tax=Streptomyces sp. NPDC057555 TaxID=3346166 RepID=UPI0036829398
MLKRSIAMLAAAAGLIGSGLAIAPAAQAAPSGCNATYLCAYAGANYSGGRPQQVRHDNNDLTKYGLFYYIQGGSLYNNGTKCNVTVYTGKSRTGSHYNLNRGTGWAHIGSNLPHISSNHWYC